MADETRDGYGCSSDSPREIKQTAETVDGVDSISSMPDEILHSILYFLPTPSAIITSALSKRWRHVWYETPCVDFDEYRDIERRPKTDREINQTLNSYRALKIKRFHLCMRNHQVSKPQLDSWIEFAISRNVEKLSLDLSESIDVETYRFPDFFYLSSSLEELNVYLDTVPECTVSWKSLRKLTLSWCNLSDESMANILSGSPVLETLILDGCMGLDRLDLSKFQSLKSLVIADDFNDGPTEIVAPYIRYFSLRCSDKPCTLVDVSFLTEASLDIYGHTVNPKADFLQTSVLKMLTKLQNAERLTFGGILLQILSLAELRGVSFPTFKVQTLTVETKFVRSFIPGITRMLRNSPGLKKLIVEEAYLRDIEDRDLDSYLDSHGLDPDQCWRSEYEGFKYAKSKLVVSFMEIMLRNVRTLETLVVGLKCIYHRTWFDHRTWFEELLRIVPTLTNNNNVSIVLKR